jgi:HK97 gp10 family phage protein
MENLLKQLGPNVARRVGARAVKAGTEIILDEARRLVRRRSGELQAAIAQMPLKTNVEEHVGVEIGYRRPTSARAHFEEFGRAHQAAHPHMRPAMDAKAAAALEEMGRVLAKGIESEARKLAKKPK